MSFRRFGDRFRNLGSARMRVFLLLTLALSIGACGGGGGSPASSNGSGASGGGGSSGGTGGSGSGTGTSGGAPALTVSSTAVTSTVSPIDATPTLGVKLSLANPPSSGFYYSAGYGGTAVAATNIVWAAGVVNGTQSADFEITLVPPHLIGSGTFHDTASAHVCIDSACVKEIAGSPVTLSVTYTVTGNAISDATYAIEPTTIALESPSNGPTQSSAINVTANELPPYGAYVFLKSQSGGAVAGVSFVQTSGRGGLYSYGAGVLTVTLKAPAVLGPGLYNDVVMLNICYDTACTKPAVGSPYQIPVTYTVTASAGREFQQQVISQNLTSLAVDPTGTILFGTTVPSSSGSGTSSQLLQINPATGAVTTLKSLPSAATQIVASQDGAFLYLLTEPWSSLQLTPPIQVIRVRRSDLSIDQMVPLTSLQIFTSQIAVSPLDSNTWSAAFSLQGNDFNVKVFDAGTPRPGVWSVTSDVAYGNQALWRSDGAALYILDANLNVVPVSAGGLGTGTQLQAGGVGQTGFDFGGNLVLAGGLLYSGGGEVLDPSNNTILGQYPFPSGVPKAEITVDTVNKRTFATYIGTVNNANQGTIESYNLSTFAPLWITRLPIGTTPLRWGSNGLAWLGPGDTPGVQALYIINGTFVAP